jgi:adenylate kinase family enzyme
MTSLKEFIIQIEDLVKNNKPNQVIKHIKYVPEFINSLKSLQNMIGMKDFKDNIISQIKYYFLNKARNVDSLDSHMFHTVLLGSPGSGKTTAAEILADIWMNLGVLKPEPVNVLNPEEKMSKSEILGSEFYKNMEKEKNNLRTSLNNTEREYFDTKVKLQLIKNVLFEEKDKACNIVNSLEKNKDILDSKLFNDLERNIKSIENGFNYILDRYIASKTSVIDNVVEDDYKDIIPNNTSKEIEKEKKDIPKFIKLRRDDLIGKFLGHTAIKTREALMSGLGKVIFIDEAYELYNVSNDTSSDSFGMECLSTILNFMNEFSDRTIIIFAGYEDLLKKTIFRIQPGLERRIAWTFTLNPYNDEELMEIYQKQLKEKDWILDDKDKILKLFKENKKVFKHGGGDTQRLAMYTKTVYSDVCFEKLLQNKEINSRIDYEVVSKALEILKDTNKQQELLEKSVPPEGMYM